MNRRDFVRLWAGSSVAVLALPRLAFAQQPGMKRLAFINAVAATDPAIPPFVAAMKAGLASEGWAEGKNIIIDIVYGMDTLDKATAAAKELLALNPDVIVCVGVTGRAAAALTKTIPIIIGPTTVAALTPLVSDFSRPSGNVTGFIASNEDFIGSEFQMLTDLSPGITSVMTPENLDNMPDLTGFVAAAKAVGLQPIIAPVTNAQDIDSAVREYASVGRVGLIAPFTSFTTNGHAAISAAVIKYRMPAVFANLVFGTDGVVNYYVDNFDIIKRAGNYAGLILNGAKVGDLPVQTPAKYILAVNLKVAKEVGLTVPQSILVRADQVVQ